MLAYLKQIQVATIEARTRLNDSRIATQAKAGKVQITRVTYDAKGKATVTPVSDWMAPEAMAGALAALQ